MTNLDKPSKQNANKPKSSFEVDRHYRNYTTAVASQQRPGRLNRRTRVTQNTSFNQFEATLPM